MSDTIILDSKKCNAELLTIHADGRITVAEHLKPTETAAAVLQIMREQWMADAQATKIREQEERIKQLEAGDAALTYSIGLDLQKERDIESERAKHYRDKWQSAEQRIKRLEAAGDEAIYPFEYAARVRIWTEAKEAKP